MASKFQFSSKRDKFFVDVKTVKGLGKYLGLMFKSSSTSNLLFNFKNSQPAIHSYFVFFPFLALWLDDKNHVLEWNFVKPFTPYVRPQQRCKKLLELPLNGSNRRIIEFFVGKGKV